MVETRGGQTARLDSLDLLRGFVMVLMALDHTRDYWSHSRFDPSDLTQTTPALFATRWVTHLCAPIFMLLVGTGAYLSLARGLTKRGLSRFLLTRGVWMIVLELTVVNLGWMLSDFSLRFYPLLVIWALGWSMIVLAALIHLPLPAIAALCVAIVIGHNALDGIAATDLGSLEALWNILHAPARLGSSDGVQFAVEYPLIPWFAVAGLGYVLGALLLRDGIHDDPRRRRRVLAALGVVLLLVFVVLRVIDVYGEPLPRGEGVMAFLRITKYPPSLLYLCATLGVGFLLLALVDGWRGWLAGVFVTFGRVPLFFYLLHLPLIHGAANVAYGGERAVFSPDPWGLPLWGVYVVWIAVCASLYPVCRWYARVKARGQTRWLRYL